MPVEQDFLPFGVGAGSNVLTPAVWNSTPARQTGFQSGIAQSAQVNTVIRQSMFVSSMIAQFIADTLAQNVLDNGNLSTLESQFIAAIQSSVGSVPQSALWHFGRDNGTVNALTVPSSPIITAYVDGMVICTIANNTTTVPNPTLSSNGLTAYPIVNYDGSALAVGQINAGSLYAFVFDASTSSFRFLAGTQIVAAASLVYKGTDTGSANALTVGTLTPTLQSAQVANGMLFVIKKTSPINTGPMTATIVGVSGALTWGDGTAFSGGEWPQNAYSIVTFDGSNWRMIGVASPYSFTVPGTPIPLLASTTYYISNSGSDSNNGLTSGTAWATPQHAANIIGNLNLNGFNVTVNFANGTYPAFQVHQASGIGNVFWTGNNGSPTSVIISTTGQSAIKAISVQNHFFSGMTVTATGAPSIPNDTVNGFFAANSSHIGIANINFGACYGNHVSCQASVIDINPGTFYISGGISNSSGAHIVCYAGGFVASGNPSSQWPALIISNAVSIPYFIFALQNGTTTVSYSSITNFSNVTGQRYFAELNGIIIAQGTTYPGTIAGSTATGGQFVP